MDVKKEIVAVVFDSIDLKKLLIGSLHLGEKIALAEAAKTATPVDDAIEGMAFPALDPVVVKLINDEVDALKAKLLEAIAAPVAAAPVV